MNWYFDVLKKYAEFSGRARRKEYWMFMLFNMIIIFVLGFFEGLLRIGFITGFYQLAVLIPSIAVGVRRMHDTDHSGWWVIVPIVNLVFAVQEGQHGSNTFGHDPISIYAKSNHANDNQQTGSNINDAKVEIKTKKDMVRNTASEKLATDALHAQTRKEQRRTQDQCFKCGKTILTKQQFISELSAKHGIEVDPYNIDRFKVSGVAGSFDAYTSSAANVRAKYDEVQKKRAFQCRSCSNTYCMECLLNYAPVHPNGGKGCLSCRGAFAEM